MKTSSVSNIWRDLVLYRRVYVLTAVASFGGMLFGWDTGLIGGVLTLSRQVFSDKLARLSMLI